MENKLKTIISEVLNIDVNSIDNNTSSQTVATWDSLNHMNIILATEEQFGIIFDDEEMLKLTSFVSLLAALKNYKETNP
jgi:acyl carrier protein